MENITERQCNKCKLVKNLNDFPNDKYGKYGKRSRCNKCYLEDRKEYRLKNLEKFSSYDKKYYKNNKEKKLSSHKEWYNNNKEYVKEYKINNKLKIRLYSKIKCAKEKDIKYDRYDANNHIDKCFIEQLIYDQEMKCIYCNINMELECDNLNDNLLTVERKDNKIGHSKSNCVLACWKCNNTRKNKYTFDEFKKFQLSNVHPHANE